MTHPGNKKKRGDRRGAITVEFALTAPLLFLFLFAILEFGRAQMIQHTLDNAVYEGVRKGMCVNSTEDKVRAQVLAITAPAAIRSPDIGVTITPDNVTVTASVNLDSHAFFSPMFLKNKLIRSSLTLSRR